jgi:hypothetical protein
VGIVVVVALGTLAWTQASPGPRPAADQAATASRSAGDPTTTAGASTATTAQGSGDAPKNLLANAGFEDGSLGWRPLGAARLTRSTEATEGGWSLRVLPESSAGGPVGITVPDVTVTKLNGRYHTNAWVRPSSPGATVTIGLREYRDGRPVPGSNTLGWTVERSRLALEIMARDLPPGGYLDVDEVVLHLLQSR